MTRPFPAAATVLAGFLFACLLSPPSAHPLAAQDPGNTSTSIRITMFPPPPPPVEEPEPQATGDSPAPAPGPYVISGIVVSAATGAPLDRAEVTLSSAGNGRTTIAEVTTGESGAFRFDHLGAGKFAVVASRRGYLAAAFQAHDEFATAVVTGPDLVTQNIRLELTPEGVIGGTVTDDFGDPVAGAQITLYRQSHDSGESRIIRVRTEITDDAGGYEFPRLRPGNFYLSVAASPWYAFRPPLRLDNNSNPLPVDQQRSGPLDVAYPVTFYPNATDSASAAPITVNPGDRVDANLSLHAVPAIHIQIRVSQPSDPARGMNIPQLSSEVFGTEQPRPTQILTYGQPGQNTVVDMAGIAPGQYTLREFGPQGEIRGPAVDLTSSQAIDFSAASATVDVSGKLAMASGRQLPANLTASLALAGETDSSTNNTRVNSDGSFDFHSVEPGRYDLRVHASGETLAVVQMAASGAEIQGSRLTVAADPVLLAATLTSGSTTVTGYAQSDGKGVGGVMILLVPADPNAGTDLDRRDQSDSDGSFTLRRVVPGAYTVVAIENGWTLDWAHPDVIAPYLARGLKIRVSDQQKTLALPAPIPVQQR